MIGYYPLHFVLFIHFCQEYRFLLNYHAKITPTLFTAEQNAAERSPLPHLAEQLETT